MQRSPRFFRWLLRLYPARFREEYQAPLEQQFLDDYRDARGRWEKVRLWWRTLLDFAGSMPRQVASELWLDLRHAARNYRSRSMSVVLAVVVLGLAIGISTGVFSVLNAVLLRSLPFGDPEQLVNLWLPATSAMSGRAAFTNWYGHSAYLQGATAFSSSDMNLAGDRDVFRVKVAETAANFFSLLRTRPAIGRTFLPDEDVVGHNAVAVISYGLWQQIYAGDPRVVGRSVHLNGALLTIIGVAPAQFDYPGKTNLWTPTVFDFEKIPKRGAFLIQTIGRLKQGVTVRTAQESFAAEIRHEPHAASDKSTATDERNRPQLTSLQKQLAGPVRQAAWALAGMTFLVLLTACANVAQLLLSRTTERGHELAIRAALGASRARLLQQMITEATLLTTIGAGCGLIVAAWTSSIAARVIPAQLATQQYTILDWRVFGFATAVAVAMGLIFGTMPVWFAGRLQTPASTGRTQPGAGQTGVQRARAILIGSQAALTLCLVTNSLALGRTFLHLLHADLGFQPASVVTLNVAIQGTRHSGHGEWEYYREALQRLRSIPGVEAAGGVSHLPLADNIYMANAIRLDSGQVIQRVIINAVTPDYFRAMGKTLLAGGDFARGELLHYEPSVIVNEAFARLAGLDKRIVGRQVTSPWGRARYSIRGVVSTSRLGGPTDRGSPEIYWSIAEEPPPTLTLVARVQGRPGNYLALCRDAVKGVDSQVPIYDVKTLQQRLTEVLARPRFYTTATGFLAVLGILLAVAGIYGSAAYSIAQRRHEMGVRMAVGASYGRLRGMMLQQSMLPVVVGMVAGVLLSIVSARCWEYVLADAARVTVDVCSMAAGLLCMVALMAVWRATASVLSIDPMEVLRAE